mmetsp:Transcript_67829/g.196198  ORF Transcript_67829/g.196198 Transcript_67829/m.196198 type:complete len:91 (-) Transcript_67829:450-722(-)
MSVMHTTSSDTSAATAAAAAAASAAAAPLPADQPATEKDLGVIALSPAPPAASAPAVSDFELDAEGRTTLMLRNIPEGMLRTDLEELFDR